MSWSKAETSTLTSVTSLKQKLKDADEFGEGLGGETPVKIGALGVLALLLVGCSPKPGDFTAYQLSESDIAVVQSSVKRSLKNPNFPQFGTILATRAKNGIVNVCGQVK